MSRGTNTADHPGRKVHRDRFDTNTVTTAWANVMSTGRKIYGSDEAKRSATEGDWVAHDEAKHYFAARSGVPIDQVTSRAHREMEG